MKLRKAYIYRFKSAILFVVIITIMFIFRTYNFYNEYVNPDEIIVVSMVEHMDDNNSFDTNWANAKNMPEQFKYDQYNFSSYILSTYLYYKLLSKPYLSDDNTGRYFESNIKLIRSFNISLSIFSGFLLYLIAYKVGGLKVALLSLFLYGITPIHVQDNLYARPEVFVTFLALLTVYLSIINHNQSKLLIFSTSLIIGLLISSKITMVLLLYIPLFPLLTSRFIINDKCIYRDIHKEMLKVGAVIAIGVISGLLIGMPYAFVNFDAFLNGVIYLRNQYSEGHYPHSPYNNYSLFMLERTFLYFYSTLGAIAVISFFVGCFTIIKEKNISSLYLLILPVATTLLPFMFQSVFFERNFSHIIPLMIIIISLGFISVLNIMINKINTIIYSKMVNYVIILFVTLALILIPLINSYKLYFIAIPGLELKKISSYENKLISDYNAIEIINLDELSEKQVFVDDIIRIESIPLYNKVIIRATNYRHKYFDLIIEKAAENHNLLYIGRYDSMFKHIPLCTLHTYHSPSYLYYLKEHSEEFIKFKTAPKDSIIQNDWIKDIFPVAVEKGSIISAMQVYSSWVSSDDAVGVLSFEFVFQDGDLYFPYLTGPVADNQKIKIFIKDDEDYLKIYDNNLPSSIHKWSILIINSDAIRNSNIRIDFIDEGIRWGEWSAVAIGTE